MKKRLLMTLNFVPLVCSCTTFAQPIRKLRAVDEETRPADSKKLSEPGYQEFKEKFQSFGINLSASLASREQDGRVGDSNFAVSPISIELCLGLAARTAAGTTRDEILDAFGLDFATFDSYYQTFFDSHYSLGTSNPQGENKDIVYGIELLNNSIWIDRRAHSNDDCLDALAENYRCESFEADFAGNNEKTNEEISEYIKEKTKGLININPRLSVDTLYAILNTIYMKDIWRDGADLPYAGKEFRFQNPNGDYSSKELRSGYYTLGKAYQGETFSCFHTYTHAGYGLYFMLPNDGYRAKEVFTSKNIETMLSPDSYRIYNEDMTERYNTRCIFPEWTAESNMGLMEALSYDFGIRSMFGGSADFSPLSKDELFCSDVKHVAKLEVGEHGIEGAAVTYMTYETTSYIEYPWRDVYEDFVVDHEFGFLITSPKGGIMFSGLVDNIM